MNIVFRDKRRILLVCIPLIIVGGSLFYLKMGYQKLDTGVRSIKIVLGKPLKANSPVAYILDSTQARINFKIAFPARTIDSTILSIDLMKRTKLRQFRLYFSPMAETLTIKSILLETENECSIDLDRFKDDLIQITSRKTNETSFAILSKEGYSYLESPRFYYPSDYALIVLSTFVAILIAYGAYFFINKIDLRFSFSSISLKELSTVAFMFSIFLPQAFFNFTLTISALLWIRNFSIKYFIKNRANLLFLAFYAVILIDFLIVTSDYNFKTIEKYTLFLILPLYVSCIRSNNKLLGFLSVLSFVIGSYLLFLALIDLSIFKNIGTISSDNFTRTIHPVYYSYLLGFSILYIELNVNVKNKYFIQSLLILLLVLCGSKLIIFAIFICYVLFSKNLINKVAIPAMIVVLFLFAPFRERFVSILHRDDLSIIAERHIENADDPRLNELTLRVILWQESLDMNLKQFIFGNGIGAQGDDILEAKLRARGLTNHLWYNAHNQYITALFNVGLSGLILLIAIICYCVYLGIKTRNITLIAFTMLMAFAMSSESIFERASGTAFFCMVILLLTNSGEDSLEHKK